jgi:hypothetical protein
MIFLHQENVGFGSKMVEREFARNTPIKLRVCLCRPFCKKTFFQSGIPQKEGVTIMSALFFVVAGMPLAVLTVVTVWVVHRRMDQWAGAMICSFGLPPALGGCAPPVPPEEKDDPGDHEIRRVDPPDSQGGTGVSCDCRDSGPVCSHREKNSEKKSLAGDNMSSA